MATLTKDRKCVSISINTLKQALGIILAFGYLFIKQTYIRCPLYTR